METTTRSIIRQAIDKMEIIESIIPDWADLAIEQRNILLDEYRRAEQTIESLAEQRKDAR